MTHLSKQVHRFIGLLAFVLTCGLGQASADPISFENLCEGTSVTTQFPSLVFSGATVLTSGSTLNEFENPPRSGTNVVFDDGGPMRIQFSVPVLSFDGYFTYSSPLTLTAFDAAGNQVGIIHSLFSSNQGQSGDPGSHPNELFSFMFLSGFTRVEMFGGASGGTFTLDDVSFQPADTAPVPEPGTLLLISSGVFMLGGALRRRRRVSARAAAAEEPGCKPSPTSCEPGA